MSPQNNNTFEGDGMIYILVILGLAFVAFLTFALRIHLHGYVQ